MIPTWSSILSERAEPEGVFSQTNMCTFSSGKICGFGDFRWIEEWNKAVADGVSEDKHDDRKYEAPSTAVFEFSNRVMRALHGSEEMTTQCLNCVLFYSLWFFSLSIWRKTSTFLLT